MQAAVICAPEHLKREEVPLPVLQTGEALIRVHYVGICGTDLHLLHGQHATAVFPLIPGHEFVGEVVKINAQEPSDIKEGDMVVAQEVLSCGRCDACAKGEDNVCSHLRIVGVHVSGGFAEYVKVPIRKVYAVPAGMDLKLAALIEPLAVAVHDVRTSGLKVGETALIIGGGPIGLLIAIVARAAGARKVVVSELNSYRRHFAEELGFETVNPEENNLNDQLAALSEKRGFDVSFEVAGVNAALDTCILHTKNTGTILSIAIPAKAFVIDTSQFFYKELTLKGARIHSQYNYLGAIDLMCDTAVKNAVQKLISKVFPFEQVEDAFAYADAGKDCMKVLVEMPL